MSAFISIQSSYCVDFFKLQQVTFSQQTNSHMYMLSWSIYPIQLRILLDLATFELCVNTLPKLQYSLGAFVSSFANILWLRAKMTCYMSKMTCYMSKNVTAY